ncbi:MAG: TldD/PmbA family protein [Acidimicrobiales bacterium]|jgi:TldD protein
MPDPSFTALPLEQLSAAALTEAQRLGCEHAEVRIERIRSQMIQLRDGQVETTVDDISLGAGCRVVNDGSFGFAATVELDVDAAAGIARDAVATAEATKVALRRRVELAPEPSHGRVEWASAYEIDPTTVPLQDKVALLGDWSRRLLAAPGVDHVTASLLAVMEDKYYCDSSGTSAVQRRVRLHPVLEALSVDPESGMFETMRTLAPPAARGYEYMTGTGWSVEEELERIPEYLAEKLAAPSVDPSHYDLVIDPTNLWLTIHESIGHATELDRAMGYEAAMAGTSFATFDQLGSLRYGSEVMHVTGDRTVEHGLATIAIDDEGVEGQSFDIVVGGVLQGYQLDRRIAREMGFQRSNGCAYAESAMQTPMQRMANVSLRAATSGDPTVEDLIGGVERGIYVVGDKSWSIDMQRHNFQFTGQRFFSIENGRLAGQLKDVAYQARTTDFWGSMEAVGGPSTYHLGGAFNCGKGQPMQSAPVSHGCPAALFRNVNILNIRAESGR